MTAFATMPRPLIRRARGMLLAGVASLALAACDLPVRVHGNLPNDDDIARLEPGQQGRTDVANLLGTPSALSTFKDDTWYYVGVQQTKFAFLAPNIQERNVLVLEFDDQDRLASKRLYTQADTREVDLVDRETPTEGRSLSILQQLLGNLGRFNDQPGAGSGVGAPTPGPGPNPGPGSPGG